MKEQTRSTVDADEIEKFSRMAHEWWDTRGKFAPLHRMNPCRIGYIRDKIAEMQKCRNADNGSICISAPLSSVTLLDIGCGGGLIAEPFAKLGARVTAIDASEKNIAVAKLHAEKSGLDIDYRCTTAENLLSPATSHQLPTTYDVVLALEIIEHVADVSAFIACASALVKPGGLIFFSTLNRTAKSYALAIVGAEYLLRWVPVGTHDWKKFLRPHEIVGPLRENNVDVTAMTGMVYNPVTAQWRLDPRDVSVNYMVVGRKC